MEETVGIQRETGITGETEFTGGSGAARLQERLQKRHKARMEDAERRKEAKESRSVAEEEVQYFSRTFSRERTDIEELLASCCGAERPLVIQNLEEATDRTFQLQKFLNDSLMFLTQYELRQAQAALQKLQTSLTETRQEALPKKKFTFRARTKAADKVSAAGTPPPADGTPPPADGTPPPPPAAGTPPPADGTPPPADGTPPPADGTPPPPPADPGVTAVDGASEQCGFSNVRDELLIKTAEEIQKQDVLLTHLSNCRVRLIGSPSTLHLKNIDSCEILCGPVSSSVFIDQCRNSRLAFPCQQLRTHNTWDTQVYLHVTSRAIIEDCRGLSFAPFSWSYPTLEEDFAVSGLDRQRNNWKEVDDFNWLAAGTPSPNWTVLPEAERKTSWDS